MLCQVREGLRTGWVASFLKDVPQPYSVILLQYSRQCVANISYIIYHHQYFDPVDFHTMIIFGSIKNTTLFGTTALSGYCDNPPQFPLRCHQNGCINNAWITIPISPMAGQCLMRWDSLDLLTRCKIGFIIWKRVAMTIIREAIFWSGAGILIGTIIILIIWPETFGALTIAALMVSFALCVLARPWVRD